MNDIEELRYLILVAQREGNRMLAQSLKPLGLTPSQAEVLEILGERGPLTLTGIGDLLVCDSGNSPSRIVDRLAVAGLVERQPAPNDRRSIVVELTPQGVNSLEKVCLVQAQLYSVFEHILSPERTQSMIKFLRSLADDTPTGRALARRIGRSHKEKNISRDVAPRDVT